MELTPSKGCCALYELHDLLGEGQHDNSAQKLEEFIDIYDSTYRTRGELCFILFTDNLTSTHGTRLAQYIKRNYLGNIIETEARKNPKSNRQVRAWIWSIDWKALRSWIADREQ